MSEFQNLGELLKKLRELFSAESVDVEFVKKMMGDVRLKKGEWERFSTVDENVSYTRTLVDRGNGKYNLLVLTWNERKGSPIHSHSNASCFLKVLQGTAREEIYDWPESCCGGCTEMRARSCTDHETNACTYINDKMGLHRISNPKDSGKLVTLHLYSPPFDTCKIFKENGECSTVPMKFSCDKEIKEIDESCCHCEE